MRHQTPFSNRLRFKLQLAYGLGREGFHFRSKPDARAWFKEYLLTTHSIIRSSVPLMQAASNKCADIANEQKLAIDLKAYYDRHILEEAGHDEWILGDLEAIGVSRHESISRKPSQAVSELVGSQYYWIYHWHPVCLLGYISFLEGNPPTTELINQLQRITDYPESGFRTLKMHSRLDPNHRDELNELLDTLPLNAEHEQWISSNALYSANKIKEIRNKPTDDG